MTVSTEWFKCYVLHTSLSNADDVDAFQDRRKTVCLDRCWNLVAAKFDILEHHGMKTRILKLCEG